MTTQNQDFLGGLAGGIGNILGGVGDAVGGAVQAVGSNPALQSGLLSGLAGLAFSRGDLSRGLTSGIVGFQSAQKAQAAQLDAQKKEEQRRRELDFKLATDLRGQYESKPSVKAYAQINTISARLKPLWAEYLEDPSKEVRGPLDQSLITSLNKVLDPTSVVRESEYARSEEAIALLNKLEGKWNKIFVGGAALTDGDRQEIINTIDLLNQGASKLAEKDQSFYREEALRMGISPFRVVLPLNRMRISEEGKVIDNSAGLDVRGPLSPIASMLKKKRTQEEKDALDFVRQNPNDPRSKRILQKLGE